MLTATINNSIGLLKDLIAIPSFSKEEDRTANRIETFLLAQNIPVKRTGNNVWAANLHADSSKPTILLNSHHDTVKPNAGYTIDPFTPLEKDGKLFGLGSNDAGASLVSLLAVFIHYYSRKDLAYNFIFAATAEEEISGIHGIEAVLPELGNIDFAVVGEPTQMHPAVSEKGLLVLDCVSKGISGHAAREEGENAIYNALKDIEWFKSYRFPLVSEILGPVKMNVTMIESGTQHNVVPDTCRFVVDIRCTDVYTHETLINMIKEQVSCDITPRSLRLRPSSISPDHSFVKAATSLGKKPYGSPTTSDQALIDFPSVKIGPGDSARSHTANEFVYLHEIEEGIQLYIKILDQLI